MESPTSSFLDDIADAGRPLSVAAAAAPLGAARLLAKDGVALCGRARRSRPPDEGVALCGRETGGGMVLSNQGEGWGGGRKFAPGEFEEVEIDFDL